MSFLSTRNLAAFSASFIKPSFFDKSSLTLAWRSSTFFYKASTSSYLGTLTLPPRACASSSVLYASSANFLACSQSFVACSFYAVYFLRTLSRNSWSPNIFSCSFLANSIAYCMFAFCLSCSFFHSSLVATEPLT